MPLHLHFVLLIFTNCKQTLETLHQDGVFLERWASNWASLLVDSDLWVRTVWMCPWFKTIFQSVNTLSLKSCSTCRCALTRGSDGIWFAPPAAPLPELVHMPHMAVGATCWNSGWLILVVTPSPLHPIWQPTSYTNQLSPLPACPQPARCYGSPPWLMEYPNSGLIYAPE